MVAGDPFRGQGAGSPDRGADELSLRDGKWRNPGQFSDEWEPRDRNPSSVTERASWKKKGHGGKAPFRSEACITKTAKPMKPAQGGTGMVISLNVSRGGVPKKPLTVVMVSQSGLETDAHNYRGHGGPDKAVCIYPVEHIRALQQEGHPIAIGTTGENVTVEGLEWSLMTPGAQVRIGDVVVEITSYTRPCKTIRESFIGGRFGRISQKAHPGWSRVYARVITEGKISSGDAVEVISPGLPQVASFLSGNGPTFEQ